MFNKCLYGNAIERDTLRKLWKESKGVGSIHFSDEYLLYKSFISFKYIRYENIDRIFLRIESGEYGDIQLDQMSLVLVLPDGREEALPVERRLVADKVFDWITTNHPEIQIGKYKTDSK